MEFPKGGLPAGRVIGYGTGHLQQRLDMAVTRRLFCINGAICFWMRRGQLFWRELLY